MTIAVLILTHNFIVAVAIGFVAATTVGTLVGIENKLEEIRDELRKSQK